MANLDDVAVCLAFVRADDETKNTGVPMFADEILVRDFHASPREACRALRDAARRDLIEWGMWVGQGSLTEKGKSLLAATQAD